MFDWDGTAVTDRRADASAIRLLLEEACGVGIELAVVSGTHLGNVDGQLAARPDGPGTLILALNRGSETFRVDRGGPHLVERRTATPAEDAALSRAAALTVERLAARGLHAQIVSQRLNRRKIDLIPEPAWADPPKARIGDLLAAVQARLAAAGIDGLAEAVEIACEAAAASGVGEARVTSDAKHVEIGLTDKSDAARWVMGELWRRGVAPGQVLVVGDEFGPLGRLAGSDANLLVDAARRATALSVGVEPCGVPAGVLALGGGPAAFAAVIADQIARRRRREPPRIDADPSWTLVVDDADPLLERVHASLLTLADGRLGTRGDALVDGRPEASGVVHAGIYTGTGADARLLPGPHWNRLQIERSVTSTRRVLDLHGGVLSHEILGVDLDARAVLMSSLARPGTAILRACGNGSALVPSGSLRDPGAVTVDAAGDDGVRWTRAVGSPGSIVAASHDEAVLRETAWALDRIACYEASAEGGPDEQRAVDRVREAREMGFERLLGEHRRAWARRWEDADVSVDGDPDLQVAVRLALYHVMASVADDGEAAVGARGLTGDAYRGHVFWDSDVYVLPVLAATHPPAARAMLEYRLRRLPAALRAARAQGREGARFPWESAGAGDDATPAQARDQRGRWGPVHTGAREEHIVADVAWAAAHYADWTGDEAFLAGPGRELLIQTARWWASRIEVDADGSAHIRAVIGPDEYHDDVDDNAYTNVMARWNLRRAAAAVPPGTLDERETRRWLALAEALADGYDRATGLYEQFAGFFALEPLLISDLASRPVAADVLLGAERIRAAQVVKQPDVLMLHYLVPDEVAPGSLRANLDWYEPRTAHGSTLSPGVHAALLARAGRVEAAAELLRLTARIDLDDIGQTTAGGVHLAAMASVWRALAFGFAGLRTDGESLAVDPVAVPGVDRLELRVVHRGSRVRIAIAEDHAEIAATPATTVIAPGLGPVEIGPKSLRLAIEGFERGE